MFELGVYGLYFYTGSTPPMPYVDSLYGAPQDQFGELYEQAMLSQLLDQPPDILVVRREFIDLNATDPRANIYRAIIEKHEYSLDQNLTRKSLVVLRAVER